MYRKQDDILHQESSKNILRAEPFESLFQGKLIKGQPQPFGSSDPHIWKLGYHSFLCELSTSLSKGEKKVMQQASIRSSFLMERLHGCGEETKMCLFCGFLPSTPRRLRLTHQQCSSMILNLGKHCCATAFLVTV